MKRLVPVLIVATVLALGATVAADHPAAPVPASAVTETGGTHELVVDAPDRLAARSSRGLAGDRVLRLKETPRQKARRIIAATWPSSQVANAMRVVACESWFNQWAQGDNGTSYGLFQVHWTVHRWAYKTSPRELFNPWHNARVALKLWRSQGWRAWYTCARRAGLL